MSSVDLWSKSKAELIDNMEELAELTAVTLVDARNRVADLEAQIAHMNYYKSEAKRAKVMEGTIGEYMQKEKDLEAQVAHQAKVIEVLADWLAKPCEYYGITEEENKQYWKNRAEAKAKESE